MKRVSLMFLVIGSLFAACQNNPPAKDSKNTNECKNEGCKCNDNCGCNDCGNDCGC